MFKSTKCTTPFQRKHVLEFSFEIVEFEEKGNTPVMMGVCCVFCVHRGQDVGPVSRKNKPIDNIHIFKALFIKQHYLSHLKQHVETWEEYNELSVDGKVKRANTMHIYIDNNQDAIYFTILLMIVNVIIKELFYYDNNQILIGVDEVQEEEEEDHHMNMEWICKKVEKKITLKCNAMKLFQLDEDNEMYIVNVPNSMRLFLAINYVRCGMLFQQTIVAIHHAKDRFKMQKLGSINNHNIDQYIHILVVTNLNKIADVLLHLLVWAFSVARDGSMHHSSSFFDMHIRIYVSGVLSNLHLVTIPMFEWHTVENIFNLIARFLDVLSSTMTIWHAKLVSVLTDGENTMCRNPTLGLSVKMQFTLPKMGKWSPPGLPKTQKKIWGVKSPRLDAFFISMERSWSVDVQNGVALPIWTSEAQVMGKRKVGSQTASLTPDH